MYSNVQEILTVDPTKIDHLDTPSIYEYFHQNIKCLKPNTNELNEFNKNYSIVTLVCLVKIGKLKKKINNK